MQHGIDESAERQAPMTVNFDIPTRVSIFTQLKRDEEAAWSRFVDEYGPMIVAWCRRRSLTEAETADVTQSVLLKLLMVMRESRYDHRKGSFRSWLKTVTNNAVRDVMRSNQRSGRGTGDSVLLRQFHALQASPSLDDLNECIDTEYQQMTLREAECRVKQRVRDFTWRAYEMTAIEGRPAREVADALNLKIAEVYVAKSRVIRMLREEVQRIEACENLNE